MILTLLPPDATLADILRDRARRTPLDRLAIDVVGGGLVLAACAWARFPAWSLLASAAACFVGYGSWAIADRRLMPLPWPAENERVLLWRAVRGVGSVVGIAGIVAFLLVALGYLMGRTIS